MEKLPWKNRLSSFIRGWAFPIIAAVLIATSFKSAIADWNDVPTGSMIPSILIGDRVFINKLAYGLKIPYTTRHLFRWAEPRRGDIVVFYSPLDRTRLIKRVIGLPGDTVAMVRNRLFINNEPLSYKMPDRLFLQEISADIEPDYRVFYEVLAGKTHPVMISDHRSLLDSFGPIQVPADTFFMMGDNRDNSADSRVFGFVDKDLILGHATNIVLSRDGSFFHPRWDRFFKKLM
jgi:signal peptidase I